MDKVSDEETMSKEEARLYLKSLQNNNMES